MCVSCYVSIGQCRPPCLGCPGNYLGDGRVQVVHDHVHDGGCRSRPARVLLDWVGPARGAPSPGVMMAGHQASFLRKLRPSLATAQPWATQVWTVIASMLQKSPGSSQQEQRPTGFGAYLVLCTPALPAMGSLASTPPGPPFLPSQQALTGRMLTLMQS